MAATHLEVLFSPAEFEALRARNLGDAVCVVFDILRATTSMVTALHHGATAIFPVADIPAALALRAQHPDLLLAGERQGLRIRADLTGGLDFDLGNSPREFTPARVAGRSIAMTTTNGTRALQACTHSAATLAASFLNLKATAQWIRDRRPRHLVLVGSGTFEEAAFEDTLAAGALADLLWTGFEDGHVADSAQIARHIYRAHQDDLAAAMRYARNGRRLLAHPELHPDVAACLQRDTAGLCAALDRSGAVRRLPPA